MPSESNKKKSIKKPLVSGVLVVTIYMSPMLAYAAETGDQQDNLNLRPSVNYAVARSDQTVEIELNSNHPSYKATSKFPSRYLTAYMLDGKTVTSVPTSRLSFDSVTGKVAIQLPAMSRNTQYAVVVGISPDGVSNPLWQDAVANSLDVVTAIDTRNKTVTLFSHGVVSIDGLRFGNEFAPKYRVGDVVSANVNKYSGKTSIVSRKDVGAATIVGF